MFKFNPTLSFDGIAALGLVVAGAIGYGVLEAHVDRNTEDIKHQSTTLEVLNQTVANLQVSVAVLNKTLEDNRKAGR